MPRLLSYSMLRYRLFAGLCGYVFNKGVGGPLLAVGVIGAGVAGGIFGLVSISLLIIAMCTGAFLLTVMEALGNRELSKQLIREFLERRIYQSMKIDTKRSSAYAVEIIMKIMDTARVHGKDIELLRMLTETDRMLLLQTQSIRQIEDLERIIDLVGTAKKRTRDDRTAALRNENFERIKKSMEEITISVMEIEGALETLLLQVAQMEQKASDLVEKEQLAHEALETLKSLQAVVNARHETAQELVRTFVPNRA